MEIFSFLHHLLKRKQTLAFLMRTVSWVAQTHNEFGAAQRITWRAFVRSNKFYFKHVLNISLRHPDQQFVWNSFKRLCLTWLRQKQWGTQCISRRAHVQACLLTGQGVICSDSWSAPPRITTTYSKTKFVKCARYAHLILRIYLPTL